MPGPRPKYPIELTAMQVAHLTHLSLSYSAPYAEVQRARMLLLAHDHPSWHNSQIAHTVGCAVETVREWRRRGRQHGNLESTARSGAPRRFPALVRARIVALACSKPSAQGKVWQRWSGEKLAQVAVGSCTSGLRINCQHGNQVAYLRSAPLEGERNGTRPIFP